MKVDPIKITVSNLTEGYKDDGESGVVAYGGMLDIRPPYQREFIYSDKQREAVIDTLIRGFPLNAMYWALRKDGDYEVVDGQQRSLSICQFIGGAFSTSVDGRYFKNLHDHEQKQILDYELMVYLCSGTDKEKLDWFELVNIAGEKLTAQELRNSVFTGPWLSDAKQYFSETGGVAYNVGKKYVVGTPNRQEYLETALRWITTNDKDSESPISNYMGIHQDHSEATPLWEHYRAVIDWVQSIFTIYRKEMKGVDWGALYSGHKDDDLVPQKLEDKIARLMEDDDVTNNKGIYFYVFDGNESHLSIRAFTQAQKRSAYERQKGICPECDKYFKLEEMEGDHIDPWHEGGKTIPANCQMLCKTDNRRKGAK